MATKFKTIMYGHIFIDMRMLSKGLYEAQTPTLYPFETTKESLIESIKELKEQFGLEIPNKEYFENLNACELVEVNLTTQKQ